MSVESPNMQPEAQKTEQQVAEQISRIAHKVGERAGTGLITVPEVTPDNVSHPEYMVNNQPEWAGGRTQLVKQTGELGKDETVLEVEADPKESEVSGHLLRLKDGDITKDTKLTQKQVISASAKILGKARGQAASKEKEVKDFINS